MRVVLEYPTIPALDRMAGIPPSRILRFSEAEKKALLRAVAIADEARELWAANLGGVVGDGCLDGEPMDTELALIGAHIEEIINGIEIGEKVVT